MSSRNLLPSRVSKSGRESEHVREGKWSASDAEEREKKATGNLARTPIPFSSIPAFSSASFRENCVGNGKLIVFAAESKRWKANFERAPSDNVPRAMGSAVIGLTYYRCEVDEANVKKLGLYRLLSPAWRLKPYPRAGQRFVRVYLSRSASSCTCYNLCHPLFFSIVTKIWSLDIFPRRPCLRTRERVRIIHRILALKQEWNFPGWAPSSENSTKWYAGAFPS